MKLLKNIGWGLLIAIFLFFGLKSCIKTTIGFGNHEVYESIDERGQIDRIFIIPHNELILSKNYQGNFELGLYQVRGSDATHYFGSLYNVGESPLGLRIYSKAKEVWNAELELKNKMGSISKTTFEDIGKRYNVRIILYQNSVDIGGETYKKIEMSESDIKELRKAFNKK